MESTTPTATTNLFFPNRLILFFSFCREMEDKGRHLEELIEREYHNPKNGYSERRIYEHLKPTHPNLTQKLIHSTLQKQESKQLFVKKKSTSDYNLVIPKVPFGRCQMDLLDLSSLIANRNQGMKWLFVLVDSYTKLVFVRPMKKKETADCLAAFRSINEEVWDEYEELIQRVDCDNEAAFTSHSFRKYCKENEIELNFSRSYDSRSKAFVERTNRYLREKINESMIARDSNNWVDTIEDIVSAYNNTKQTTTKRKPVDAVTENSLLDRRIDLNRDRKQRVKIAIGDRVRVLLQTNIYSKGTDAKWSKTVHTVERTENGNRLFVSGREGYYKDYELLPVGEVKSHPTSDPEIREAVREEATTHKRERKIKRVLDKESIDPLLEEKDINSRVLRKYKIKPVDRGPYLN